MRLILNESQYNRLFNKQKKKLVINESQYKRLILEANTTNSILSIDKTDIVKLTSGENTLHFKVVAKNGGELIMINCNDGVYKNAYFYVNGSALNGSSLSYKSAQNKDIDMDNPWETIKSKSDIWRPSTFKNINEFKVFKGGSEGLTCNLSDDAKEKFGINMETGVMEKPGGEVEGEEDVDLSDEGKLLKKFKMDLNRLQADTRFVLNLANSGSDNAGDINIEVLSRSASNVDFEIIDVSGDEGEIYRDLIGKTITLKLDDSNINVEVNDVKTKKLSKDDKKDRYGPDEYETDDIPMFGIKVNVFNEETDKDGNRESEEEVIANITGIGAGVKIDRDAEKKKAQDDKDKENNALEELTDEEQKDLMKRLVTNNEYLRNAISSRPNHVLELLRLSRKKGLIPISKRMDDWEAYARQEAVKGVDSSRFGVNEVVDTKFSNFEFTNKNYEGKVNIDSKFKSKSVKSRENEKYTRFLTNFKNDIKLEDNYEYVIYLLKEVEDKDDFYVYNANLLHKTAKNVSGEEVGTGKLYIKKIKTEK